MKKQLLLLALMLLVAASAFAKKEEIAGLWHNLALETNATDALKKLTITDGLVAYYPFNGNANDESGNGNNGTPMDNVTLTTGVHGDANGAYQFGGTSNPGNIHVPNSESLMIGDEWSFAAYVKPLSLSGMDGYGTTVDRGCFCIMAKSGDRNGVAITYEFPTEDSFYMHFNSWGWDVVRAKESNGSHVNEWTHVAITKSGNLYKIYINGAMLLEVETEHDFSTANSEDMYFGKYDNAWFPMNGVLDEVCIYNRALDSNEVKLLAQYAAKEDIVFADATVKNLCVANWDANGDKELSYDEAAAVTDLGMVFSKNTEIKKFDELQYFTGLTSIGGYAFDVCSSLASIIIPNTVTSINDNAFYGCSSLASITIPSSVSSIADLAFSWCSSLASIVVEEGNTIYDSRDNCNAIINSASNTLFKGCKATIIPSSVTSIGSFAFDGQCTLSSISIPSSVTSIGFRGFNCCSSLTSITIPASVTSIETFAFSSCSGLTSIIVEEGNPCYDSRDNSNAIIETASNTLLWGCKNTIIPNSVNSIDYYAFYDCSGLTSITIPSSVTFIGWEAFSGCTSLTSVTVEMNTPVDIESNTFTNRANATLFVPTGCKAAYEAADYWKEFKTIIEMKDYASKENIVFADATVKNLCVANWDANGDNELSYDEAAAVTDLGKVFTKNTEIKKFDELQYFTGLTSIGGYAFDVCSSLASIIIPNTVTSINENAFYGCSSLASITIPSSVSSIADLAFSWCSSLASIVVEEGNTHYDSRDNCNAIISSASNTLFKGCKTTIIPSSVTRIGSFAFDGQCTLSSISIPSSVTSIGFRGFNCCSSLTSITIPASVTSIQTFAFNECTSLTSVTVEMNTPVGIEPYTFTNRTNATLIVPVGCKAAYEAANYWNEFKTIVEMKDYAAKENIVFADATVKNLCVANWDANGDKELSYDEAAAVTDLGLVFSQNTEIKKFDELQYFTGLTSIGDRAFRGCNSLASVIIPNAVASIGDNAFYECSGLTSITIPSSVSSIAELAFSWCSSLASIVVEEDNTHYDSRDNCNAIISSASNTLMTGCKTTIIPSSVTSIGDYAFNGQCTLTSISIPSSVTSIGFRGFNCCSSLTSITIPASVTSIETYAFNECTSLTSVTVEMNTPVGIEPYTFTNRANATLIVPVGCKAAYEAANYWKEFKTIVEMKDYASKENIVFADATVKNLCVANWDANGDKELSYDEAAAVTDLGLVFSQNTEIKKFDELQYFTGLTSIGDRAFRGCNSLASVIIPNTVTRIGDNAFYQCSSLASITIPSSVSTIVELAFSWCSSLASIVVEEGNTHYDSRDNCNAIISTASNTLMTGCKTTIIPSSVTSIGSFAFDGQCTLTSISIPSSVTSIGFRGFNCCSSLTSITIPASVTSIRTYAFNECTSLTSVTVEMNTPVGIEPYTFTNRANATLIVPVGCKAAYEAANYWKEFKTIVEMKDELSNTLFAKNLETPVGSKAVLLIEMANKDEVKLCQFDLRLPEGVTVAMKSNGKLDAKLTARAVSHGISSKLLSNNDYRFVISSLENDSFTGNEGTLVEITLDIPATMEAGEYTVKLLNTELSVPDGTDLKVMKPADTESKLIVKSYTPGDVNNDGSVSVTDVGCAINYILEMVPSVFIFEAADMNGDKSVSVTDVGMIINLILNEGAASRTNSPMQNVSYGVPVLNSNADGYLLALDGQQAFTAFQMDILPAGTETCEVRLSDKVAHSHLLTCRKLSDGHYRVVCYSPTNEPLPADATELLGIVTSGDIALSDIRFTTVGLSEVCFDDMSATTTGIADASGLIPQPAELKVYSLDGRLCRIIRVQPGENPLKGLKAGIYMIDNRKVVVR